MRQAPEVFAAGGVEHLILEVLAYPAEEAAETGRSGRCLVALHADGSLSVTDDGRGTAVHHDAAGQPVRKPVMATRDLRFFDSTEPPLLPDGHPRRGMSTVAALSSWLVHTNHRADGSWTQRYEHGIPATGLDPIPRPDPVAGQQSTGTTVHFLPAPVVGSTRPVSVAALQHAQASWPQLRIEVVDERPR